MWVMTLRAYQPFGFVVGLALRIKHLPLEDVESSNSSVLSLELPPQCQLNVLLPLVLPLLVALLLRGPPLIINIASPPLGTTCPSLTHLTATSIVFPTPTTLMKMSSPMSDSAISSSHIVVSPGAS